MEIWFPWRAGGVSTPQLWHWLITILQPHIFPDCLYGLCWILAAFSCTSSVQCCMWVILCWGKCQHSLAVSASSRGWWADKGTLSAGSSALPNSRSAACPGCDSAPVGCRVTRQFFLLLFCYYSLLLFIPFTGATVALAPHVFIMGFSVRVLTFRMNGWVPSCLWSKALFVTALQ